MSNGYKVKETLYLYTPTEAEILDDARNYKGGRAYLYRMEDGEYILKSERIQADEGKLVRVVDASEPEKLEID